MVVILLVTIYLTEEYINLEGVLDAVDLDGEVCKHSYEHYYDFNRANPVPFLQTPLRRYQYHLQETCLHHPFPLSRHHLHHQRVNQKAKECCFHHPLPLGHQKERCPLPPRFSSVPKGRWGGGGGGQGGKRDWRRDGLFQIVRYYAVNLYTLLFYTIFYMQIKNCKVTIK